MTIVHKQALKLIKERWFEVADAVKLAIEQQTKRWFWGDWKETYRGKEYSKLSSEKREEVRRKTDKWDKINDFVFSNSNFKQLNG